jgi:hypothetical protein
LKERSYAMPSSWYSRDPSENADHLKAMRKAQERQDEKDRLRKSRKNKKTVAKLINRGGAR